MHVSYNVKLQDKHQNQQKIRPKKINTQILCFAIFSLFRLTLKIEKQADTKMKWKTKMHFALEMFPCLFSRSALTTTLLPLTLIPFIVLLCLSHSYSYYVCHTGTQSTAWPIWNQIETKHEPPNARCNGIFRILFARKLQCRMNTLTPKPIITNQQTNEQSINT